MKKRMIALMAMTMSLAASSMVWGGAFDNYTDFQNEDGTYSYYFDQGVLVTMDENWYQKTIVVPEDLGATFYQKASYEAYASEGMVGGRLFTIGASVNNSFQNLPNYEYIGFDEENAMNYFADLPSDYQAYMGDESIRAEYDALWAGVEDVIAGIRIPGETQSTEDITDMEPTFTPEIITSGDYSYWIEDDGTATIAEYTGSEEEIEIPSEIDGYPVSVIGYQAFTYKEMKSLSVPDSVNSIGGRAFEYCAITDSLQLPEGVTIGKDAFSYAELPSVLMIPAGAAADKGAFSYCDTIKQVFIEQDALISSRVFGYCENLEQVVCAEGSQLQTKAFEYCDRLGQVVFCGAVQTEEETFSYCGNIETIEADASEYDVWAQGDPDDKPAGGMTGGWQVTDDIYITEDAQDVFDRAMKDLGGVDCEAIGLLATQVVAGTNYCFLCRINVAELGGNPSYKLVYIWEDIEGNAQVLAAHNIEFGINEE